MRNKDKRDNRSDLDPNIDPVVKYVDPIQGLNAVLDWGNTLSLGEQQRLAFGRIVVNQPRLVILVSLLCIHFTELDHVL